ncbi:MAG: hypothetical protein NT166_31535 [Candidatus Aminicenantes bacterium]|nr:hypothetical protein [Candidatus Aminicenantes bacterium]
MDIKSARLEGKTARMGLTPAHYFGKTIATDHDIRLFTKEQQLLVINYIKNEK